jgi:hypothetical protein
VAALFDLEGVNGKLSPFHLLNILSEKVILDFFIPAHGTIPKFLNGLPHIKQGK